MELIVPILINCILVLGVYMAEKYTVLARLPYIAKQIIIGILFGGVSAFASSFGVKWLGAVVNVRDAAPLSAGLIFGAPAGIIAGCIGGLYRWFSIYWGAGTYTRLACSIATILAGLMAALLRKRMFDNKKPTWGYGVWIAVACEVIHMILIFITNMGNSSEAFEFVKGATIPMIIGNAVAVGAAIVIVSLLSHDRFIPRKSNEKIANTFQRWLLACIAVAFIITSSFTYILQNGMVKIETQEVFTTAINDVEAAVKGKSDAQLRGIAEAVRDEYENSDGTSLSALADKYGVAEINIVRDDGIITDSNDASMISRFVEIPAEQDYFAREYGQSGEDSRWRKYGAVRLEAGGFIQVGYNATQFHKIHDGFVVDVTSTTVRYPYQITKSITYIGMDPFYMCRGTTKVSSGYTYERLNSIPVITKEKE